MTTACRRDLACYRNDGHAGDHAYATPDTVPTPAPNWQAGYDAGYREAQEDAAMTTPREDAIAALLEGVGQFLRRVGGLRVEFRDGKAFLPVRDDWVSDLEAGYRAALGAEAETPDPERLQKVAAIAVLHEANHDSGWVTKEGL